MISPEFSPGETDAKSEFAEDPSSENHERLTQSFPVLLVLGGGFKKAESIQLQVEPGLSRESRMRVLAAGEMFKAGIIGNIILTGGKTAGGNNPSEAEAMKLYLQSKYPQILDEHITLEDSSLETSENMGNMKEILENKEFDEAIILTSETHLKRAEQLAQENHLNIIAGATAEDQIISRSPRHYERFVENYTASSGYKISQIKEFILRSLLIIDRGGSIPRFIAHQTRKK